MEADLKFLIPLSISVVVLNSTAIWLVWKTKKERKKSTSMIITSLLVSDMLVGAAVIPLRIIEVLLMNSVIFPYIYAYLLLVAAFNVLFLTYDRYASIERPLHWKVSKNARIRRILAATWLIPVGFSVLPVTWRCFPKILPTLSLVYRYIIVGILMSVICVVVVIQVLLLKEVYGFYFGNNKKKDQTINSSVTQQRRKSSAKKKIISASFIIGVTLSTIITWLPTIILNFRPEEITTWLANFSLYSLFVNSLLDPLLVLAFNFSAYTVIRKRNTRRRNQKKSLTMRKSDTRSTILMGKQSPSKKVNNNE